MSVENGIVPPAQLQTLAILLDNQAAGDYPLTLREVARRRGHTNPQVAQTALIGLESHNLITHQPGKMRTVRPTCRFIRAEDLGKGNINGRG